MTDRTLEELVENDIISANANSSESAEKASILKNCSVANDMKMNYMKVELQKQELSIREKELELEKEKLKLEKESNDMKVELQNQELSIREKELEFEKEKLKSQNRKDICLTIVNGTLKILGIAACAITAAAFVGSSMRMAYQDQMVPPKGLGEGIKFISSIGSKLI